MQAGYFGVGRGIIWLDDLECTGNETRLVDCNDGDVGDANCRHNDDANVICPGITCMLSPLLSWYPARHIYMLMVSLFIRCNMRCEIWAQPAELPR